MSDKEVSAGFSGAEDERCAELVARITDDIVMARIAPEKRLSVAQFCKLFQTTKTEIECALVRLVFRKLLSIDGDTIVISSVDRASLLPRLEDRLLVEQDVAHAAAIHATNKHSAEMSHAILSLKRSAMVGDIEAYITADRRLERVIGAASGLPEKAEELAVIKREFRRAWCAFNRLRDLNVPSKLRQNLVDAIIAGKPEAATAAVREFIEYLRKSF